MLITVPRCIAVYSLGQYLMCGSSYCGSSHCALQDKLREVSVVVFVVSSTGDGDAPENCERMVGAIQRKSWGPAFLSHLQYTVCGMPLAGHNGPANH